MLSQKKALKLKFTIIQLRYNYRTKEGKTDGARKKGG